MHLQGLLEQQQACRLHMRACKGASSPAESVPGLPRGQRTCQLPQTGSPGTCLSLAAAAALTVRYPAHPALRPTPGWRSALRLPAAQLRRPGWGQLPVMTPAPRRPRPVPWPAGHPAAATTLAACRGLHLLCTPPSAFMRRTGYDLCLGLAQNPGNAHAAVAQETAGQFSIAQSYAGARNAARACRRVCLTEAAPTWGVRGLGWAPGGGGALPVPACVPFCTPPC